MKSSIAEFAAAARRACSILWLAAAAAAPTGCVAVYPEIGTKLAAAHEGEKLDPPPPENVRWMKFLSARIPERTRDGRPWHSAFGKLPDPYAKLLVNGEEIIRTPVQSETLEPTWPTAPHGNFPLKAGDRISVELWDANPINDHPIGIRDYGHISPEILEDKQVEIEIEGGARITVAIQPAHAMMGLGLWFELRTNSVFITRTLDGSPAKRAGLGSGDEVVQIGGRDVKTMTSDEVRSQFNAVPFDGLKLSIRKPNGAYSDMKIKEGPIYPLYSQFGSVD